MGAEQVRSMPNMAGAAAGAASAYGQVKGQGTVRAVRPARQADAGAQRAGASGMLIAGGAGRIGMSPLGTASGQMQPMGMPPLPGSGMMQAPGGRGMNGAGMPPMRGPGMPITSGGLAGQNPGNNLRGPGLGAMPQMGGMSPMSGPFGQGAQQPPQMPDWRLPPMPEMPPLPNWDGPQMSQGQPGPADSYFGNGSRAGVPPYGNSNRGPSMPGRSGPNSRPNMSGPIGEGWPEN
jgi:hypothetical protein